MDLNQICLFNKFGHCRFRDACRKRHISDICEINDCEISECSRRHPRECRYWNEYGRCKFSDFCSFKHKPLDTFETNDNLDKELTTLKEKLEISKNFLLRKIVKL